MKSVLALFALFTILLAFPVTAEEITVDKVLAAQSFGAPAESILARINDPANTVPSIPAADVEKLRAAMVPEPVVSALLAKAPPAAPIPAAGTSQQPDNPKAVEVVKVFKAGTSEKLIVDQLMQNGVVQRPSLNDLIYLKENNVPEGVIRALMELSLIHI